MPGRVDNVDIRGIYPRLIHNIKGVISTYPRTYPHTYPHRKVAIGTIFMQKRKCLLTLVPGKKGYLTQLVEQVIIAQRITGFILAAHRYMDRSNCWLGA
jgi:hypothetical protein